MKKYGRISCQIKNILLFFIKKCFESYNNINQDTIQNFIKLIDGKNILN